MLKIWMLIGSWTEVIATITAIGSAFYVGYSYISVCGQTETILQTLACFRTWLN